MKKTVTANDGYPLISYALKIEPNIFKGKSPKIMLFYIQGAEYDTVLSKVGVLAGSTAIGASVVVLEGRGIDEDRNIDVDECYGYSMKEIRIDDHLKVINEYLKDIDSNIPVLIMAEGEGGYIASVVATREKRVTHLILLGSGGGWRRAKEFEFFLSKRSGYFGIHNLEELNSIFEDIKAQPDSMKMWAGHPYVMWSFYLWKRPMDYLEKLDIPIFVAHGDKDENIPVESARAVQNRFEKLGKDNLTYKEYQNMGHYFVNLSDGLLMSPLIEVDILEWMEEHQILSNSQKTGFEKRVKNAHPEFFD